MRADARARSLSRSHRIATHRIRTAYRPVLRGTGRRTPTWCPVRWRGSENNCTALNSYIDLDRQGW